jgi:hypothetical protein
MYAPHFAAALAIESRVRRAPLWALLVGAFLPDLVWIVFARAGVEPAQPSCFFDDWSQYTALNCRFSQLVRCSFLETGAVGCRRRLAGPFSHISYLIFLFTQRDSRFTLNLKYVSGGTC